MKLSEKTFPCKDCKYYIRKTTFPAKRRWCTNLYERGYMPIRWDPKTGWSCAEKKKEIYKQLTFDF